MYRITQIVLLMLVICLSTTFFSTIEVTAAPKSYNLTMAVSGNGTTSPPIGTHEYDGSKPVPITATPAAGWQFVRWTGDVSNPNSASTTVKMDRDKTVTANFTRITQITSELIMTVDGNGTTSPSVGVHTYNKGTVVNITATSSAGWQFVNWSGDVTNPNTASTTVTMDGDKTVTANFNETAGITHDLTMSIMGSGNTTPSIGTHTYNEGTTVDITATPDSGWQFVNWSGDVANPNTTSTTVIMDGDKTITANFVNTTILTVPNVTSAKANGFYTTGEVIDITISFGEEVIVDTSEGTPYLELEVGDADRNPSYLFGSRTGVLVFRYTVQEGDTSSNLDYRSAGSFKLNGGTISDTNDNDISVILAVPGAAHSLGANKALVIDTTDPAVMVTSPSGGEIWAGGSTQEITWEANDANMAENPIIIDYYDGTDWVRQATDEANDGSYTWTPLPGINISNAKVRITAKDKAGNTATHSSGDFAFIVDTTKPVITPDETSITTSDSSIRISGKITKMGNPIAKVEYLVDEGNWNNTSFKPDLAASNSVIYDFNIFLSIGQHTVEIRATDNVGNTVYAYPAITVERTSDSGEGSSLWIILGVVGVFCLLVILGGTVYFFFMRETS